MNERDIQAEIWEAMSRFSVMFRNNVGSMEDKKGNWVRFGLVKGSSDLIGWTRVKVTQDMVGSTVAVFTAIECKTERGKPTETQKYFIARVKAEGGFAGVAKNVEDAMEVIQRR